MLCTFRREGILVSIFMKTDATASVAPKRRLLTIGAVGVAALAASLLTATPAMAADELTGVVTSAGAPAAEVEVYLYKQNGTNWSYTDDFYTGSDGAYSFDLPSDGTYALYYSTEDSSAIYSSSRSWDDKSNRDKMAAEFTVAAGVASKTSFPKALPVDTGAVSTTFIDAATGAPVPVDVQNGGYSNSYFSVQNGYTDDGYVNDGPDPLDSNSNGYASNVPTVITGQVAAGTYYSNSGTVNTNTNTYYTGIAPTIAVSVGSTTTLTIPVYDQSLPYATELIDDNAPVAITGVPKVGALLTAPVSTVAGLTYSNYQWFNSAAPIVGATATTYVPTTKDLGQKLSVTFDVTAAGRIPSKWGTDYATKRVAVGDPNTGTVAITGTPAFGNTLKASVSAALAGSNTYQWYLNGAPIAGADGSSYTVPAGAVAGALSVAVKSAVQGHTDATIPSPAVLVAKDAATVKATVAKKATTKSKLKVKVALTAGKSGISATAKVKVFYTKTKFKTVTVKSNKSATVTLPALKKGTTTIKVVYPGTSQYAAKTVSYKVKVTTAKK